MTKLSQQMIGELQLRNFSEATIHSYVHAVERFARFFGKSPSALGCEQVKDFLLHLKNNKKCKWSALQVNRAALRLLNVKVLKQTWFEEDVATTLLRRYGFISAQSRISLRTSAAHRNNSARTRSVSTSTIC